METNYLRFLFFLNFKVRHHRSHVYRYGFKTSINQKLSRRVCCSECLWIRFCNIRLFLIDQCAWTTNSISSRSRAEYCSNQRARYSACWRQSNYLQILFTMILFTFYFTFYGCGLFFEGSLLFGFRTLEILIVKNWNENKITIYVKRRSAAQPMGVPGSGPPLDPAIYIYICINV